MFGDPATRRQFLKRVAGTSAAITLGPAFIRMASAQSPAPAAAPTLADTIAMTLKINGQAHQVALDPRTTLLDALREHLQLTGSKKGCDHGQCGACTVLVNGRRVNSCLLLAAAVEGDEITTIEGLAQRRRTASDAGCVCRARWFPMRLLHAGADLFRGRVRRRKVTRRMRREIREWMSGNLCRCGAYPNIVAAIKEVAGEGRMNPFAYTRASGCAAGDRALARSRTRSFSAAARIWST